MKINYEQFNLKNGIKVIYLPKNDNNISCISVFVGVGSINEPEHLKGASHFLEHILFKGTVERPNPTQISKELDSIGAYFNAYTDKDLTSFIIKLDSKYLEKGLSILGDMLLNSIFDNANFELEKRVVVEEINKSKDSPEQQLIEDLYKILFKGNPLENSIGAEEKYILNYTRNDVINYYKKYYVSNNICISISSNLDVESVKSILNNTYFKDYTKNKENKEDKSSTLEIQSIPRFIVKNKDLEQVHVAIGFPIESRYTEDKFTLEVIKILLAGNMSSRLFIDLRETHGLSYNVSVSIDYYKNTGCFYIYTSFDKDSLFMKNESKLKNKEHLENILFKEKNLLEFGPGGLPILLENIKKLKKIKVGEKELNKVKGYLRGSLVLSTEDSHTLTDYYGKQVLHQHNPIIDFNYLIDKFTGVTAESIIDVSNKYFNYNKMNISISGDYNKDDVIYFIKEYLYS